MFYVLVVLKCYACYFCVSCVKYGQDKYFMSLVSVLHTFLVLSYVKMDKSVVNLRYQSYVNLSRSYYVIIMYVTLPCS